MTSGYVHILGDFLFHDQKPMWFLSVDFLYRQPIHLFQIHDGLATIGNNENSSPRTTRIQYTYGCGRELSDMTDTKLNKLGQPKECCY